MPIKLFMELISQHKVLVVGDSYSHSCEQVHRFFDQTQLVMYDYVEAIEPLSCSGLDIDFLEKISFAEKKNSKMVSEFIRELTGTGIQRVEDLARLEQGYQSKALHILSHFLDGFVGIDSYFYNIIDDSHWLPKTTIQSISKNPGQYWLIHIDCYTATPEEASLLHM